MIDLSKFDFEAGSRVYKDWQYALEQARAVEEISADEKTNIHFYWRVGNPFGRKQVAPLKAAIVSQRYAGVAIHLWLNVDLTRNEFFQPIARHIHFHIYDPLKEAIDTPLEGRSDILLRNDHLSWLDGDLFRLLILFKYGGVYVDMDVLLLRDLSPLLEYEWMYQWGTDLDKINGAVMRMKQGSPLAEQLLCTIPLVPASTASTDWGCSLYAIVREQYKDWIVWPCAWFNTEWQNGINMSESGHPFKNGPDSGKDFPGAFSWHWHNKWDSEIEEGSKFQRLEKIICGKYAAKYDYMVDKDKPHLGGNYGGGDIATYTPKLWKALCDTYGVKTILDAGCGQGFSTRWFSENYYDTIAFDGLAANKDHQLFGVEIHDLNNGPFYCGQVDLVWCCEVAEHIDADKVQNLIRTLAQGNYIAMTAAPPGQSGWHHVNCQPEKYWIDLMDAAGYIYLERETGHFRELAEDGWFKRQGLLFMKRMEV